MVTFALAGDVDLEAEAMPLRLLYRDVDRTPYLYALKFAAERHGLQIDVERPAGREYGDLLARGEADVLAENYYGLQSFAAKGAPFVSVATSVTSLNELLLVPPDISSIDDLAGKRFALRGVGSSELISRLWLADTGLDQKMEAVVFKEADVGRWGHWNKVVSGECHACLVTNLYADPAIEAGLKPLPIEPFGYMGNVTLTTSRDVIRARRADIEVLVRAAFEASTLLKTDRSTALGLMGGEPMQLMKIESKDGLARAYEIISDELSDRPVPSVEGLRNMRRMALPASPELADFNPLLMWDLSFAHEVIAEAASP